MYEIMKKWAVLVSTLNFSWNERTGMDEQGSVNVAPSIYCRWLYKDEAKIC